jgi:hypothetical protein
MCYLPDRGPGIWGFGEELEGFFWVAGLETPMHMSMYPKPLRSRSIMVMIYLPFPVRYKRGVLLWHQ